MKVIAVTGTPGTGKTTVARRISRKKGCKYVDVTKLIKENRIYDSYDRKKKAYDVDTNKLNKFLIKIILSEKAKKTKCLVIDSHLSHYLPSRYVNLCVVTKADLKKIKKRLEKRGYSAAKVRENLDAEIFDVCLNEAKEEGHKIKVVRT
jgi:adenylate kinase